MTPNSPNIHNYLDYRDYLADWFKSSKAANSRMSFRFMSRNLGLKSPNHFQLVITKKRHFSKKLFAQMQKLLRLRPKEKHYLDLLFLLGTENDPKQHKEILAKVHRLSTELIESDVSQEQYAMLSNSLAWYLKMGALSFTNKTEAQIFEIVTNACPFPINEQNLSDALKVLEQISAVTKKEDLYVFDLGNVKTDWDFDDKKIKQFHYNNLKLAMQTIPWPIKDRFLSNVTIPCNEEILEVAKKEIRDLCIKLLNLSNIQITEAKDQKELISLQFAMFPYFKFDDKKTESEP